MMTFQTFVLIPSLGKGSDTISLYYQLDCIYWMYRTYSLFYRFGIIVFIIFVKVELYNFICHFLFGNKRIFDFKKQIWR